VSTAGAYAGGRANPPRQTVSGGRHVNPDHARFADAPAHRDPSDPVFRHLANELALTEYALAAVGVAEAEPYADTSPMMS
jgi:hypothetical protein